MPSETREIVWVDVCRIFIPEIAVPNILEAYTPAMLCLSARDDPDVRTDPGVIEELIRQPNDGFQPIIFDDPAPYFALA
jgi:hypothetical protein